MSAATAITAQFRPRKKLIILVTVLLLLALGGGAWVLLKKKSAANDEEGAETSQGEPGDTRPGHDAKPTPSFVALDPFTVNLADQEAERYAQIGVTLEIHDAKAADALKAHMPIIRGNILMVLSHKTAAELLTREGKERLAGAILKAAVRPLGYELAAEGDPASAAGKTKKPASAELPVKAVHFSNFIVQ